MAEDFQTSIDSAVESFYLSKFKVSNKRQLTGKQKIELEKAKNKVLSCYCGEGITTEEAIKISQSTIDSSEFENKLNEELSEIKNPTTSFKR